ncbi:DUF177 domain-containing protein [Mesobacterium sp. TK19101]|uniref:DUF177 domain-containing protein n=1 Tax=Mesobacterium hydrothermale TaxID=3111907 RepID=A0ABU6HLV3_9RHOB|nr:DUF177 domain-containing protein [Mesobacterium sp. TK19101]MEC3862145.1 DUF177 domain-containing protein [Mesobacterium sp. TK19101]
MTNKHSSAPRKLRTAGLSQGHPTPFLLAPEPEERKSIAQDLGLGALRKLRFDGAVHPEGHDGWRLQAKLGATVVQPCVVTLVPVTTRIDVPVVRVYSRDADTPAEGSEIEMPEDDTLEPLTEVIDLGAVMIEALALNLPDFPRADGAALDESDTEDPAEDPFEEEENRPFAALQALRDKMDGGED